MEVKHGAELVYVGKTRGKHTMTQDEINELLVSEARKGRVVVRLKGGDPYVFGRGEEECMYVMSKGVKCEVVPGVTSAVAVPAYAGIPVTHRYLASSFAVVTGQETEGKERRVDIKCVAKCVDTLVILMPVGKLASTVSRLLKVLPPNTPAAIISEGCTNRQKVVVSDLKDLPRRASEAGVRPPAVVVVGSVVKLRDKLWKTS